MNTSTLLGGPLLLVLVLAVSWAAAVPLNVFSGNEDLIEDPETFLEQHPSIARQLYPHLLNAASDVTLILDRDDVLDLLRNYMAAQRVEEGEAQAEEEHERRKRDTTVSGDVHTQVNPNGRSVGVTGTLEHAFDDNHSLSGTAGATRNIIPGLGSFDTYSAAGGYHYSPRDDTTVSVGAHRNWLPGGSTVTGASGTLEHSWDNSHSISATAELNRNHIPGFDSFNSDRAEVNYNWSPNRDTTLSIGGFRTSSPFGRDHGFGLNFMHRLGR